MPMRHQLRILGMLKQLIYEALNAVKPDLVD